MSGALLLHPAPAAPRWRMPVLAAVLAFVAIADLLLWVDGPGLSLGLAALLLGGLFLWRARRVSRGAWIAAGLLGVSAVQSAVAVNDANILVLGVLLLVLLGEAAYPALAGLPARMAAALRVVLGAWRRWRPAWRLLRHGPLRGTQGMGRMLKLVLPALLVALPFALLLGEGNAVLGNWMDRALARAFDGLFALDLGPGRILFWLLAATLALAFLRPLAPPRHGFALLGREVPAWTRPDPALARWQAVLVLGTLNALFLMANAADVLHLWAHQALPQGVGFSAFVHRGTDALILATLLSGVVIAAILQQGPVVAGQPLIRLLALGWIAQNLMLLASVVFRLWLYVEAYQLSILRVWLGLFLLLVAGGFILLAWHVLRGIGLRRLVLGNAALAFAIGFGVQFADIPALVARTNVQLWQQSLDTGAPRRIDLGYLASLGPSAWPSLARVADDSRAPMVQAEAWSMLARTAAAVRAEAPGRDWRSMQFRTNAQRKALLRAIP